MKWSERAVWILVLLVIAVWNAALQRDLSDIRSVVNPYAVHLEIDAIERRVAALDSDTAKLEDVRKALTSMMLTKMQNIEERVSALERRRAAR